MTMLSHDPEEIAKLLRESFPPQVLSTVPRGGQRITYVPVAEVIIRLNDVLGAQNWSAEVLRFWRDEIEPDWLLCHVRLTATIAGYSVIKEQFGGQKIKKTNSGTAVDIGDEYKGAFSDALKKAAQLLGVGIDLSRKDEAVAYDEVKDAVAAVAAVAEQLPTEIAKLRADIDQLIPMVKDKFKEWWSGNKLPNINALAPEMIGPVRQSLDQFLLRQKNYLVNHPEAAQGPVQAPPQQQPLPPAQPPVQQPPPQWSPQPMAAPAPAPAPPTYDPRENQAYEQVMATFPGSQPWSPEEEPF